jgi:hypothetical protein
MSFSISFYQGGDWDSGGNCKINDSIEDYSEQDAAAIAYETAAQRALREAHGNIKHLNITFLSMNRRDAHPSGMDVLHAALFLLAHASTRVRV